jgi:aminopeptidase N
VTTLRRVMAGLSAASMVVLVAAEPATAGPNGPGSRTGFTTVGAPGVGDPFFPAAGNGGYDVRHYDLSLDYTPATRRLDGTARITAVATQLLTRFDLDLRSALTVSRVSVNGLPARFTRQGAQELVITPRLPLLRGLPFLVSVTYGGVPETVVDPDDSLDGWIYTDDGVFVAGEPQGAASWFPGNDHPSDKASFTTRVSVPDGIEVVGNGSLLRRTSSGGRTTFVWNERFPMATYLATVTMGTFQISTGRTASGIPTYVAVDPREAAGQSGAGEDPGHRRVRAAVARSVPVRVGGRDRGQRAVRGVRPGVADQAGVRPGAE